MKRFWIAIVFVGSFFALPVFGENIESLKRSAELGNAISQYRLATKYYYGDGVPQNPQEADKWYSLAALKGFFPPLYRSDYYYDGRFDYSYPKAPLALRTPHYRYYPKWRSDYYYDYPVGYYDSPYFYGYPSGSYDYDRLDFLSLRRLADSGDPQAQFSLGTKYFSGDGIGRNFEAAARWYRQAAMKSDAPVRYRFGERHYSRENVDELRYAAQYGDVGAQYSLGAKYFFGEGVSKNYEESSKWYRQAALESGFFPRNWKDPEYYSAQEWSSLWRAAQRGDPIAKKRLGYSYGSWRYPRNYLDKDKYGQFWKYGSGYRFGAWNVDQGNLNSLRSLAEKGDSEAQCQLAARYYFGNGVPQNSTEAARWYRKASLQGNPFARYWLGMMNANHEDIDSLQNAAYAGDADAQFQLGERYYYGNGFPQNFSEAEKWYQKSAQIGNPLAQYRLGIVNFFRNDFPSAEKWLRKSAQQGNFLAQYNLGVLYEEGKGVKKNLDEAIKWYSRVAEKGSSIAQGMMGILYYNGEGILRNFKETARWFSKATFPGLTDPQIDAAILEDEGVGIPNNFMKALAWLSIAPSRKTSFDGFEFSQIRRVLASKLSPSEVASAQTLASNLERDVIPLVQY